MIYHIRDINGVLRIHTAAYHTYGRDTAGTDISICLFGNDGALLAIYMLRNIISIEFKPNQED